MSSFNIYPTIGLKISSIEIAQLATDPIFNASQLRGTNIENLSGVIKGSVSYILMET